MKSFRTLPEKKNDLTWNGINISGCVKVRHNDLYNSDSLGSELNRKTCTKLTDIYIRQVAINKEMMSMKYMA